MVELNRMQAEMREHADGRKGALRILANTSVITYTLPGELAAFTRANPDVQVIVEERWSDEIVRALRSAEADLGFVVEGTEVDGLDTLPYCVDRIAVVMRNDHPLASFETLGLNHVFDDEVITLEGQSSVTRLLAAQAAIADRALQIRAQVRSFEAICHMVAAGLGLGLLPEHAAHVMAKGLDLTVRPLNDPWASRQMLLCMRKERAGTASVAKLLDFLSSRRPAAPASSDGRQST